MSVALAGTQRPATAAKAAGTKQSGGEVRHRLTTKRGPVYVYRAPGVSPVFTVVYVHGFYDNVDSAWKDHDLAAKFARSHLAATFVVPEAPMSPQEPVVWTKLDDLLGAVRAKYPKALSRAGPVVLVGHSAAYRTMVSWLDHRRVSEIFLVDALYGFEDEYATWLKRSEDHRIVVVVKTTDEWAVPFVKRFRFAMKLQEIPTVPTSRMRHTRLLSIRSQYDHMALVKEADPLPALLRLSRYSPVTKKAAAAPVVTGGK